MTTVADIRRQNLDALAVTEGTLEAVAAKVGSSAIYLGQIRNRTPDAKNGRPREMGSQLARRLEQAFGKPAGWMDQHHAHAGEAPGIYRVAQKMSHPSLETAPVETDSVPVIGTLQMGASNELELRAGPDGAVIGTVPAAGVQSSAFAIRVVGDHLYPTVRHGACLLIDPDSPCTPGELVLAEMVDGHFIVCELIAERAESISVSPVQGGQRQTLPREEVRRLQCVAGVLSGSLLRARP